MTPRGQLAAAVAVRKEAAAAAREAYKRTSGDRLAAAARRKHTTTLIGLLARFEGAFGPLWGHGKADADLSPAERAWRARWEACRTDCLNHGHAQLRALEKELAEYSVEWLRHQTNLVVRPQPRTEDDRAEEQG